MDTVNADSNSTVDAADEWNEIVLQLEALAADHTMNGEPLRLRGMFLELGLMGLKTSEVMLRQLANKRMRTSNVPLIVAVLLTDTHGVKWKTATIYTLLRVGADVNVLCDDVHQQTPLMMALNMHMIACASNIVRFVSAVAIVCEQRLQSEALNHFHTDSRDNTSMHYVVTYGTKKLLQRYVERIEKDKQLCLVHKLVRVTPAIRHITGER